MFSTYIQYGRCTLSSLMCCLFPTFPIHPYAKNTSAGKRAYLEYVSVAAAGQVINEEQLGPAQVHAQADKAQSITVKPLKMSGWKWARGDGKRQGGGFGSSKWSWTQVPPVETEEHSYRSADTEGHLASGEQPRGHSRFRGQRLRGLASQLSDQTFPAPFVAVSQRWQLHEDWRCVQSN